jgi:6-phosphogluconolactonase
MPAHEPDLDLAARRYEESLRRAVPAVEGIPALDLVWLGMGSDGHTASLFPGASSLEEARRLVVASEAPGRGTRRLTFTYPLLNRAHRVQFLVTGGEKAATLARVLEGKEEARELPAARVQPEAGSLEWVVDLSAASAIGGAEILSEAP